MSLYLLIYKDQWKLLLAIFLTGLFTISSQVLILREVMYLAQGNELTLGFIFFLYIALTALGSFFAAQRIKIKQNNNFTGAILLVATITVPLVIIGFTFARIFLVDTPTELIPVTSLLLYVSLIITPSCLIFGALLPLFAKLLEDVTSSENAFNITFFFESIGGGIGGSIIILLVIPYVHPINVAFIISVFIMITLMLIRPFLAMPKLFIPLVTGVTIVILSLAASDHAHIWLKKIQWQDLHFMSGESSKYGYVEAVQNGTQNNIYENGALIATEDASDVNRNIFKIAFLQTPHIKNILLIGGGLNGLLGDAQRANIERCDYLEPNRQILKFMNNYFAQLFSQTDKLSIYNIDEINYLKRNINTYDLIILSKPAPNTLINNRFYTVEYYHKVYSILNKQGLVFFSTASSSTYITEEHAKYLASIYKSLKQVFPVVDFIPGDDFIFVASKSESFKLNTGDQGNKELYFDFIFRKNIPIKRDDLQQTININLSHVGINNDFSPRGYIYYILQGSNYLFTPFYKVIKYTAHVNFLAVILTFTLAGLLLFIYLVQNKNFPYHTTAFIIGFTSMSMQLIIMLVFQVIHGFLFYQLGILIALFMIGLSIGGGLIIFLKQSRFKKMHDVLAANCSAMLLIIISFLIVSRMNTIPVILFNSISILLGVVSGFFFLSVNYLQEYNIKLKANMAIIYGFNLLGTSIGALLSPLFLGIWGMNNFCFLIILLNIVCLIIIISFKYKQVMD